MSPLLASLLFYSFIFWLFYRNAKRSGRLSPGSWVTVLWIAMIASRPVTWWLNGRSGADAASNVDGSAADRNVSLLLIFLAVAILLRRKIHWGTVFHQNSVLWLFYLYMLASVLWSDYPFVAFKRYLKDIGHLAMILVLLTEPDPIRAIHQVFIRCVYVLIPVSILLMKYYVETGSYYNAWTGQAYYCGVADGKNQLGRLAMLSGLIMVWSLFDAQKTAGWFRRIRQNLLDVIVFMMCIWVLFKANSATSVGCFAVGTAVFLGSRAKWLKANPRLLALCGCGLVAISVLLLGISDLRSVVTRSLGRDPSLTERTDVWKGCFELGTDPLLGAGFASVWLTPGGLQLAERLNIQEAHNGYLETYLNGGLVGVALLLAVLFSAGRNVFRKLMTDGGEGGLYAMLLLAGLIYNYTEAAFSASNLVTFVVWLVVVQYRSPFSAQAANSANPVDASTAVQADLASVEVLGLCRAGT